MNFTEEIAKKTFSIKATFFKFLPSFSKLGKGFSHENVQFSRALLARRWKTLKFMSSFFLVFSSALCASREANMEESFASCAFPA